MAIKLSITIITLNEERIIGQCLEAVKHVADEIVVVDSFSTDRTKEICLSYGARFIENSFEGHIQQKNFAVEQTSHDYILSLDADEILSEELIENINTIKNNWDKDAYYLLRRSHYCGRFVNYGDWYPDRKIRLFKKDSGRWAGTNPHDTYTLFENKQLGKLKGDLKHYTFNTVWAHIQQANKFSSIGADELIKANAGVSIFTLMMHPAWRFTRSYILRLGFMDGLRGFAIAVIIGIETFLKYLKVIWPVDKYPFNDFRVLQISSMKTWRGGEQQVANLVLELKKKGSAPYMVVAKGSKLEEFCRKNDLHYSALNFNNGFNLLSAIKLKRICERHQIDIVHMHCSPSHTLSVFSHLFGNNAKLVLSRRVIFPIKKNRLSSKKFNYHAIEKILCVSSAIKDIISPELLEPEKCEIVYDGISIDNATIKRSHADIREEFNISEKYIVGIIAALSPEKDHLTFLKAASKIRQLRKDVHFLIVGEGQLREKISSQIAELGLSETTTMTGFRNDIPDVLQSIDVLCMTSTEEGLGSAILEASANRIPVVATRVGGIPEVVEHGKSGLLSNPGDVDSIAQNIENLINDAVLANQITNNAFEVLNQKFTIQQTETQTSKVYSELINRHQNSQIKLQTAYA